MGHVMDCYTAAVMDHDGLVVDYYGDGVAAMWNAPTDQAEHAELACRAALRIVETLPDVAADWAGFLDGGLPLGIGIHTGTVQVGNAGSSRRMKYGPRGQHVHLASRVEAAAKRLHLPLVVTRTTAERLSNRFATHRVCRARMRGIPRPVELFSVSPVPIGASVQAAWDLYDAALRLFEQGELTESAAMLRSVDTSVTAVPTQFLADEVQAALGRQKKRRSTDARGDCDGIVTFRDR
jgi:adenylate cyclase